MLVLFAIKAVTQTIAVRHVKTFKKSPPLRGQNLVCFLVITRDRAHALARDRGADTQRVMRKFVALQKSR